MGWSDIEGTGLSAEEREAEAKRINALRKQEIIDMAKTYHRLFTSEDGLRVMEHLTNTFIFNNATPLNAPNPTFESGYHSGESGVVQFIVQQIQKATIL